MSVPSLARFKPCTKCGMTYPATIKYFFTHKLGRYGLHPSCKRCEKQRGKDYREKHWRKRRESQRKWEANNREQYLAIRQANYQKNHEARLEEERQRRANNPEYFKQKWREWDERNPGVRRVIDQNRRAKLRQAEGTHTAAEILGMYDSQDGLCAYCECELGSRYEVDHMMPVTRGGRNDWTNLAVTCRACNRAKSRKTVEEFMG